MKSNILARDAVPPITLPPDKTLLDMLQYMKLTRELEFRIERKLYRQGKIVGGVYVGRGQEAIAVGSCIDLRQDGVVCPSHRDMGAFVIRGMTLRTILAQYMARKTGATRGKDGNMHMGDLSKGLIAFVSMLGDNVPVAAGIGLSFKMRGQDRVALCFFGDGATISMRIPRHWSARWPWKMSRIALKRMACPEKSSMATISWRSGMQQPGLLN